MSKEALRDWYEHAERVWRPLTLQPTALSPSRYDNVAALLSDRAGGSILDVGCGAGGMLVALAERFDRLVGFDYCKGRISLANEVVHTTRADLGHKTKFLVADAEGPFPFEDETFDVVLLMTVLELVKDVFNTMGEVARVCKDGGICVLTVRNLCSLRNAVELLMGNLPPTWGQTRSHDLVRWRELGGWQAGELHNFNLPSICALLRDVGFRVEKWVGCGKFAGLLHFHPLFAAGLAVRARRVRRCADASSTAVRMDRLPKAYASSGDGLRRDPGQVRPVATRSPSKSGLLTDGRCKGGQRSWTGTGCRVEQGRLGNLA
jgi:ubiquinone/menaquinone biosynthesis C-methylase UbiE